MTGGKQQEPSEQSSLNSLCPMTDLIEFRLSRIGNGVESETSRPCPKLEMKEKG